MVRIVAPLLAPLIQMLDKRRIEEQLLILEKIPGMESLGMLWKYLNNHWAHQKEQYFILKGSST